MSRLNDCKLLLDGALKSASVNYFQGACDAMEVFMDYSDMFDLLSELSSKSYPRVSREVLRNKIEFYGRFAN